MDCKKKVKGAQFKALQVAKGPKLTEAHKRARLSFEREREAWTIEHCGSVLSTDGRNKCTVVREDVIYSASSLKQ